MLFVAFDNLALNCSGGKFFVAELVDLFVTLALYSEFVVTCGNLLSVFAF